MISKISLSCLEDRGRKKLNIIPGFKGKYVVGD